MATDDYRKWLESKWADVGIDLTSEQQKRINDYEEAIKTSNDTGDLRGYTEETIKQDLLDEENNANVEKAKSYYQQKIEATFGGTKGVDHRVRLTNQLLDERNNYVEKRVEDITSQKAKEIRTKIENKRGSISKANTWRTYVTRANNFFDSYQSNKNEIISIYGENSKQYKNNEDAYYKNNQIKEKYNQLLYDNGFDTL